VVTIRKTIVVLLLAGFVARLLFGCWLHISYASNLPEAPDEKTGHIYQMAVNHGFIRYGTERELHILRWTENTLPIAIAFLVVAAILGVRYDIFKKKGTSNKNMDEKSMPPT
jgi:hypothetical protein